MLSPYPIWAILKALRGEHEDAKSMLNRAARLKDGRTPTTYLGLAVIEQSKGNYLGALESFIQLEKRSPKSQDTLVRIGVSIINCIVKLTEINYLRIYANVIKVLYLKVLEEY